MKGRRLALSLSSCPLPALLPRFLLADRTGVKESLSHLPTSKMMGGSWGEEEGDLEKTC